MGRPAFLRNGVANMIFATSLRKKSATRRKRGLFEETNMSDMDIYTVYSILGQKCGIGGEQFPDS